MKLRSQQKETSNSKRKLDPEGVSDFAYRGNAKKGKYTVEKCFKQLLVSFAFGPPELNRLSFVAKRLKHLMNLIKSEIPRQLDLVNRFLLCHHSNLQTKDVCLLSFDSIPNEEMSGDASELTETVVVCYVEENLVKEKKTREFMQHLYSSTSKENFFLIHNLPGHLKLENILKDWKMDVDKNHLIKHNLEKSMIFKQMYRSLDGVVESVMAALQDLPEGSIKENAMKKFACIKEKLRENHTPVLSKECKGLLQCGQDIGIIAYRTDGKSLTVYTSQPETRALNAKLKELEQICSPLSLRHFNVQTPIFRKHSLMAGSKLVNMRSDFLGTLGLFAKKVKDGVEKDVAITSAHVIWEGCTANSEMNGEDVEIGTCTWPPKPSDEHFHARIKDLALVQLNPGMSENISTSREIFLYVDSKEELAYRCVYKHGCSTGKSEGDIDLPVFDMYGNNVMVITRENQEKFSEPGDSGALVLTEQGNKLYALGLIFGDDLNLRESDPQFPENASFAIYLDEAIRRFERVSDNERITLHRY
ncbi:uncharacterized protein LOC134280252 [Saccostrea cucullata]